MSRLRTRVLLAAVSAAVAGAGGWLVIESLRGPITEDHADHSRAVQDLLLERSRGTDAHGAGKLPREPLSQIDAEKLYQIGGRTIFDAHAMYRYRPGLREEVEWSDHPDGRFLFATNAAGMREDGNSVAHEKPDLRIVVVGDSHTDGFCNNSESFPNLLERELSSSKPGSRVDVLNTGVSGYSFYHYLGALEGYMELEPDIVVVAFYSGNDFIETLKPLHFFQRTVPPPWPIGYWGKIEGVAKVSSAALLQGLNQVIHFQQFPEEAQTALEAATVLSLEIARQCRTRGIRPIFLHIPQAFDFDRSSAREMIERCRQVVEVSEGDLASSSRLAARLMERLRDAGVEILDLSEAFAASEADTYWHDFHINIAANRIIAERLVTLIGE